MLDMKMPTVAEAFHEGELAVQSRAGVREQVAERGRAMIRDCMLDQHRIFFAQLPMIITGCVEKSGQAWASILVNPPGFMQSPDPNKLEISAMPHSGDPLYKLLTQGASIALLGIEQHTRRRNRMNGVVTAVSASSFAVEVQQSFGNCPKYIQARQATYQSRFESPQVSSYSVLNAAMQRFIETADTFFIASAHPQSNIAKVASHGVDVSHRGGKPGFVKIIENSTLLVADYSGNRMFNTLGNITLNPLAGLLFIDYESGDCLQLAVNAEVIFDGPLLNELTGAERVLKMKVTQCLHTIAGVSLSWGKEVEISPFLD